MTPAFQRFWFGEAVSGFGTWVTLLALQTIVVLDLHGGAAETGLLNAARWAPYLVLGLVLGALVDRWRRRPLMIATDLVRAAVLVAVPVTWAIGVLTLPLLLGIVLVLATATLLNDAASQSFVPRLVPREDLQVANARLDTTNAVAQTAGPAIGGLLVRLVGAPAAVLADAATYLVSAATVASLRVEEPPAGPREERHLRREIADGVRWVYRGSGLRDLAVWTHVWFAGQAVLTTVLAPYVLTTLGVTPFAFGLVMAASGVGGVTGAVLSSRLGRRFGTGGAVVLAHAASTLGACVMLAAALAPTYAVTVVLLGLGQLSHGFAMSSSNSHEMAYRQTLTPDELMARTNTTMRSLNRAVVVVVAPLAGVLADVVGVTPAFAVAAVLFGAVTTGLLLSPFRRVRLGVGGSVGA